MIKKRAFPKVYFGWWTILVTGIMTGLGNGIYGFGFSVFFKSLATELGISRAVTSVATGIGRLEGGLGAPITGWLTDKYGPRGTIFTGACIVTAGLALMYFVDSLWTFYLVWGMIGFGSNLGLTIAVDKAVTNWFVRKRGFALGMRFVLIGTLAALGLPIISWLVNTQGWRMTNVVWAGLMAAILPFIWFFVRRQRPEYYGLLPDGATVAGGAIDPKQMIEKGIEYAAESADEVEFTLRQAMRTRAYWMLFVAWTSGMSVIGGISVHIIPFLTDKGIDQSVASGMMAMMIFFTIPARFIGGILADRVPKTHLQFFLVASFLALTIGITTVVLSQTIASLWVFLILYGIGSGASTPVRLLIGSRYFGRKAFTSIMGSVSMIESPLGFLAPIYSGWIYDTTGDYRVAFITFAALTAFAMFLMLLVRPPKPPSEVTDITKFV
ncbi:MAG: MFS transporter [Chloroflexi bacterium]|nr:MFS transporter [Chloroflexota bacterium]